MNKFEGIRYPMLIDSAEIYMHQVGFELFPDMVMLEVDTT